MGRSRKMCSEVNNKKCHCRHQNKLFCVVLEMNSPSSELNSKCGRKGNGKKFIWKNPYENFICNVRIKKELYITAFSVYEKSSMIV